MSCEGSALKLNRKPESAMVISIFCWTPCCVHIYTYTHEYREHAVRQTYAKLLGLPLDVPAACSDWSSMENKPRYRV